MACAGKCMSPVAAVPSTQVIQTGSQFGHGMILDIFGYGIKALCTSYNELDSGAAILIWHSYIELL